MATVNTIASSLHRIDLEQDELGDPSVIAEDSDFDDYIDGLVQEMYESERYKSYGISSSETEVVAQIPEMLDINNWQKATNIIASRLLRIEKQTQEKVKHMVDLRVGSLVQILAEVDGEQKLIITKVDHSSYLDEETLKEHLGLPKSQRVQKTAVFSVSDGEIESIHLSDSNNKISQYWWQDFLEVVELNSSEKNTSTAFLTIDKLLRKEIRKKSKSDFWTIRNAVVSYFRTRESLIFDTLISDVFDGYEPDSSDIDIDDIKKKVRKLPEKHNFDTQFDISIKAIKARIVDQIKLADNLELKFTGEVPNLQNLIKTGEEEDGRKFIQIFSDMGYEEFNKATSKE